MKHIISLTVNGDAYSLEVEPWWTLLQVLREKLYLTGTKNACARGNCGACTVVINGKSADSCLTLAVEADGKEIQTIEGLAKGGKLHPVQEAFVNHGAIQCGFCTPGMVMSAKSLLERNPKPTEAEVREGLSGNLCRCTGYTKIVEAVLDASQKMSAGKEASK